MSDRQPSSSHSFNLDNSNLYAGSLPIWIPTSFRLVTSYDIGNMNTHDRQEDEPEREIPPMEDVQVNWPLVDRHDEEIEEQEYSQQNPIPIIDYSIDAYGEEVDESDYKFPSPSHPADLPPFASTSSTNMEPLTSVAMERSVTQYGHDYPALASSPSSSAPRLPVNPFRRDHLAVPPCPPPSPMLTPPPSPPFVPRYEEAATLGRYNVPTMCQGRPSDSTTLWAMPPNTNYGTAWRLPAACYLPEDSETDFEDDDDETPWFQRDPRRLEISTPTPTPPPSVLVTATATKSIHASSPSSSSSTASSPTACSQFNLSKALPATPDEIKKAKSKAKGKGKDKGKGKTVEEPTSFMEWDNEPETAAQWIRSKTSRSNRVKTPKRRGSESDESASSKISIRERAERLRRKLDKIFGKKH